MTALPFRVSLDLAFAGLGSRTQYDEALTQAERVLSWLREGRENGSLPLLSVPFENEDIARIGEAAAMLLRNTSEIAVLGIGGSSLGGQVLHALGAESGTAPEVTFYDNADPESWSRALARFDLKTTRFVAISKSGSTAETLFQTLTAADAIEKAGGGKYLKHHFVIVTEAGKNPLRDFALSIGATTLDHPSNVGGRYSVFTVTGMLPAILMGLDAEAVRRGAREVINDALSGRADEVPAATGAALHQALAAEQRLNATVLWTYADRLRPLGPWWRQLWAESLGKNGKGSTPVAARGPADQHSQLQLFRDGQNKALFTIISTETAGKGPKISTARAKALGLGYLGGHSMGDLVHAEARATAETLTRNGRPVRRIAMDEINEYGVGALMMHFMLETMITGRLMGVDPFDQPGVEEGKHLTRAYLEREG